MRIEPLKNAVRKLSPRDDPPEAWPPLPGSVEGALWESIGKPPLPEVIPEEGSLRYMLELTAADAWGGGESG